MFSQQLNTDNVLDTFMQILGRSLVVYNLETFFGQPLKRHTNNNSKKLWLKSKVSKLHKLFLVVLGCFISV